MSQIEKNAVIQAFENTLVYGSLLAGAFITLPYTAPLATQARQYAPSVTGSFPLVALTGMDKLRKNGRRIASGLATAGTNIGKWPGMSQIIALTPKPVGSGIKLQPVNSIGKAMGLSFSFNVAGPGFRAMTRFISTVLADISKPGTTLHHIFQTNRRITIGHTVQP